MLRGAVIGLALSALAASACAQATLPATVFMVTSDFQTTYTTPPPVLYTGKSLAGSEIFVVRAEFDLSGRAPVKQAYLTFQYLGSSSYYGYVPPSGTGASIVAYTGDNAASAGDLFVTSLGTFGNVGFGVAPALYTFDVTYFLNAAIDRGDAAFGVGLNGPNINALTMSFSDFALTIPAVPEPHAYALMLAGLALLAGVHRRTSGGYRNRRETGPQSEPGTFHSSRPSIGEPSITM